MPRAVRSLAVIGLSWILCSCTQSMTQPMAEDLRFPSGFLFGTAIAGFQTEMGCPTVPAAECEDRNSDWYTFITAPSLVADKTQFIAGDPPSAGPGFYALYAGDLA